MKILSIKGCNIASLEGNFEINFEAEPLLSAGIFAISGPTGAGKSTILDAMCLALFCETPRTVNATENNVKIIDASGEELSQDDTRSLLRRGTASGYAEVAFEALNKDRYSAKWSVSRAYNKIDGRLQDEKIELWNLTLNKQEQGTKTNLLCKIEQLIGLKFQQFTRTVLLAQNDFATFLKAKQEEKAALLEKLTGTQIYSIISSKVFDCNKLAIDEYNKIQDTINNVNIMPQEEYQAALECFNSTKEKLRKLDILNVEYRSLIQKTESLNSDLKRKQSSLNDSDINIRKAISLFNEASDKYKTAEEDQKNIEDKTQSLTEKLKEARKLDQEISSLNKEKEQISKLFGEAKKKKEDNEKNLLTANNNKKTLMEEKKIIEDFFRQYENKKKVVEQYAALKVRLQDADLIKIKQKEIEENIIFLEKSLQNTKDIRLEIEKQFKEKKEELDLKQRELLRIEEERNKIDTKKINKELEDLEKQRERKLQERIPKVEELRSKLEEGVPCPVCGSAHHPYSDHSLIATSVEIDNITVKIQTLKHAKEDYDKKNVQIITIQQTVSKLKDLLTQTEKNLTNNENDLKNASLSIEKEKRLKEEKSADLSKIIKEIDLLFEHSNWQKSWTDSSSNFIGSLNKFVIKWKNNEESLQQKEKEWSVVQERIENLSKETPEVINSYQRYEAQLLEKTTLLNQILDSRKEYWNGTSADEVEDNHNKKIQDLKKLINELIEKKNLALSKKSECEGIISTLNKDISSLNAELQIVEIDKSKWKKSFADDYETENIDELIKKENLKLSELSYKIRMREENKKLVDGMKDTLDKAFEKKEEWGKLNDLIGSRDGSKFKQAVQVYTLDYLVEHANFQLRRLNPRYGLKCIPGKLALEIIDHDMCDEIRSVHTLSGGESFLVSLALAIGLAGLSSNQMNVESLFIDEGFGSLDAETLRTAMEALENLRTEGRKIGVISHVQEMTERIPVQVKVARAGNGRSIVETESF